MPEKIPAKESSEPPPNNPYENANYQGDFDSLFLSRIQSPIIKQQVIKMLLDGGWEKDAKGAAKRFTQDLKNAKKWPKLVPGNSPPDTGRIFVDWSPLDRPLTGRERSMIAAHEKGHQIRPYRGEWFQRYFLSGLDPSKAEFTETDYKEYLRNAVLSGFMVDDDEGKLKPATKEEIEAVFPFDAAKDAYISGVFRSVEIAERMAQLKNYFGMKAHETFTAEHLKVARERYLVDLPGCDNGMTQFFQAITPETEERFLYLINNSGI
jgi:hypothetical protein